MQVQNDIYCFENVSNNFEKMTLVETGKFELEDKAKLLYDRFGPALCNFKDELIFISGGIGKNSVERYTIETDEWELAPPMIIERHFHSSVAAGSAIYVFCGQDDIDAYINSIERLDCSDCLDNDFDFEAMGWQQIMTT